jgi:hypothetical protein
VLFFDRQHDRARAYIERARRAQAERQRESEAALHQAIEAFRAGDVDRARRLVTLALDRGASPDEAQGMLERIERLEVGQTSPNLGRRVPPPARTWSPAGAPASQSGPARRVRGWSAAVLLAIAAVGVLGVAAWGLTTPEPDAWFLSTPGTSTTPARWTPEPLPVPQASERHLARARSFVATGRVHDALAALDRIPVGDPLRLEADRLRADAQQHLLSVATRDRSRE